MKKFKITLVILTSVVFSLTTYSQTTITLQPGAADGKDATITDYDANTNFGTVTTIDNEAHSAGGTDFVKRNLIQFDLSQLPSNIMIIDARLSLYYSPQLDGGTHETLSGSNACWLQRVTSPWDEATVSWNTQPSTTSVNQVEVPMSTNDTMSYPNIDVTALVQEMVDSPGNSYGFLMRLQIEQKYRRLVFASSDHANTAKHPKLVITYSEDTLNCMTFQPGSLDGKDVTVNSYYPDSSFYYVTTIDNEAHSQSGTEFYKRNFFQFDLSQLPSNINIASAILSLFYSPQLDGGTHETLSGSNACLIQRVNSQWDETTVTWNNQPTFTTQNQVEIPMSTNDTMNYPDIDVTDLVIDMINDPANSFGFRMRLKTEQKYRRMVFASSDHANAAKHPKLVVCYTTENSINKRLTDKAIDIYPNPANDIIMIELHGINESDVMICNMLGEVLQYRHVIGKSNKLSMADVPPGIYFIKVFNEDFNRSFKIVKN